MSKMKITDQICKFSNCGRKIKAANLCQRHYDQMRAGVPLKKIAALGKNGAACAFPGCSRKPVAKNLCNTHWAQSSRRGVLSPITTDETEDERWLRSFTVDEKTGCWNFIKNGKGSGKNATAGKGYGQFWWRGKKQMAHRYSWERVNGPIPAGTQLDHMCRNTFCVNPDHLQIVTQCENLLRMKCWRNLVARIKELETFIESNGLDVPRSNKKKGSF